MIQVDFSQIQAALAHYFDEVARGETVVVCKDQEPIAEIRPAAKRKLFRRRCGHLYVSRAIGKIHWLFAWERGFHVPFRRQVKLRQTVGG